MSLTFGDLDDMVEGDALLLRDRAWGEILRLQVELEDLRRSVVDALGSGVVITDEATAKLAARVRPSKDENDDAAVFFERAAKEIRHYGLKYKPSITRQESPDSTGYSYTIDITLDAGHE